MRNLKLTAMAVAMLASPLASAGVELCDINNGEVLGADITGTTSADSNLKGTPDCEIIYALDGDDFVKARAGSDTVYGGSGKDTVYGGWGKDTLYGEGNDDTLYGENGADEIYGGDGDDTLYGGTGEDTIVGGIGDDVLDGGEKRDEYYFTVGDGADVLNDTGTTGTDKIYFSSGDSSNPLLLTDFTGFCSGSDFVFSYSANDQVTLTDGNGGIEKFYLEGELQAAVPADMCQAPPPPPAEDYVKIDSSGNELPDTATSWDCVLDNNTGLLWEKKTDDGGLRDKTWRYMNTSSGYDPLALDPYTGEPVNGANEPGTVFGSDNGDCPISNDDMYAPDQQAAETDGLICTTENYIEDVKNTGGICGYTDWRMPTIDELVSLLTLCDMAGAWSCDPDHNGGISGPFINQDYFPNIPLKTYGAHYWSSTGADYCNIPSSVYYYDYCPGKQGNNNATDLTPWTAWGLWIGGGIYDTEATAQMNGRGGSMHVRLVRDN